MLVSTQPADRRGIDADSTAVLAFDDGTIVPCDRFVMRTFCEVVRRLLDSGGTTTTTDSRGRTVIPVPCQDPAPFWVAVDLLHGARLAWQLTAPEVLGAMRCMGYLGCASYDLALDARLWSLLGEAAPLADIIEHVPRLLRNPVMAAVTVRRLIRLRPLWAEFVRDVLEPLERGGLDQLIVGSLVVYAPNFFPPALVVDWALGVCPRLTPDLALRLASHHGVMYHPAEVPAVLARLAELLERKAAGDGGGAGCEGDDKPLAGGLAGLLRMSLASLGTYEAVPWAASRVHGSLVKYHDMPVASVCLALEPGSRRPPRRLKLAPWLTLGFAAEGRLEATFRPRRIDCTSSRCSALQLRVMCFDSSDAPRGRCAEAWMLFAGFDADDSFSLADARDVLGDLDAVETMLRERSARQLRLDFFFGRRSVLDNPFDPAAGAAAKTHANFLLAHHSAGADSSLLL